MQKIIIIFSVLAMLLLREECHGQSGSNRYTAGINYTVGVPTFVPQGNVSRVAIDTGTMKWYEYAQVGGWRWSGDRVQDISGCAAPAYVPGKAQSRLVLNACTEAQNGHGPELYKYTGSAWLCLNCGGNYTAGDGIGITGTEITNTAPDQVVSIAGAGTNTVTGTYPNFTITGTEVDGSVTNELQTLSISNDTLSISDGNSVVLPGGGVTWPLLAPSDTIAQYSFFAFPMSGIFSPDGGVVIKSDGGEEANTYVSIVSANKQESEGGRVEIFSGSSESAAGGNIQVIAGGSIADAGGVVSINAGNSTEGDGGSFYLQSGNGDTGGDFTIGAGSGVNKYGGNFTITSGNSENNNGGDFVLNSGSSTNSTGGNFSMAAGNGLNGGNFLMSAGSGTESPGGRFAMYAGASTDAIGGDFEMYAGGSDNNTGGNVVIGSGFGAINGGTTTIQSGYSSDTGTPGNVVVECGTQLGAEEPKMGKMIMSNGEGFRPSVVSESQRGIFAAPEAGDTIFCSDCTANDSSTGVLQTYNGTTWKNHW